MAFWALALLGYCLFIAPVVRGFVLKTLWGWFIVSTFGLPPLSMASALGLGLLVQTLVGRSLFPQANEESDMSPLAVKVRLGKSLAKVFLEPAVLLFFGWIVHSFMS